MGHWNGDEWRWRLKSNGSGPSLQVIESTEKREESQNAQRVPFGFGVREPRPEAEPLLWEGSD